MNNNSKISKIGPPNGGIAAIMFLALVAVNMGLYIFFPPEKFSSQKHYEFMIYLAMLDFIGLGAAVYHFKKRWKVLRVAIKEIDNLNRLKRMFWIEFAKYFLLCLAISFVLWIFLFLTVCTALSAIPWALGIATFISDFICEKHRRNKRGYCELE